MPSPKTVPSARRPPAAIVTDWCQDGDGAGALAALDEQTCYVLPTLAADKPRRLLIYLHGIVPPVPKSQQKDNVMKAVVGACERAGAAALVPRGVRGVGPKGAVEWWAWPTSVDKYVEHAPSLIERLARAKKDLETVAGASFERTYLAGSSNGAYFLTMATMRGDFERHGLALDGVGAMSGGSSAGATAASLAGRKPLAFYVGFGTLDEESTAHGRALGQVLTLAHWPVTIREHAFGHGAREVYVSEAFAFWDTPR